MYRRDFIENISKATLAGALPTNELVFEGRETFPFKGQNTLWSEIGEYFPMDGYTNLRSLWTGISPNFVIEKYKSNIEKLFSNKPTDLRYKGQTDFDTQLKATREIVASYFGAESDEIAFVRNTTEGLMNVIFGLDFKRGDEIIISNQEYSLVKGSLEQLKAQKGIVVKQVKLPLEPTSAHDLVEPFKNALTEKTKAIFCCHVYLSGLVFPVKELKKSVGEDIFVIVDGALAIGTLDLNFTELGCDFYAGSFHKAMGLPRGMGFLFMKKIHIESTWPLFGHYNIFRRKPGYLLDTIKKFEHYGQFPDYHFVLIADLIEFHEKIGKAEIENRLKFLKNYWTNKVKDHDSVKFITPLSDAFSSSRSEEHTSELQSQSTISYAVFCLKKKKKKKHKIIQNLLCQDAHYK